MSRSSSNLNSFNRGARGAFDACLKILGATPESRKAFYLQHTHNEIRVILMTLKSPLAGKYYTRGWHKEIASQIEMLDISEMLFKPEPLDVSTLVEPETLR